MLVGFVLLLGGEEEERVCALSCWLALSCYWWPVGKREEGEKWLARPFMLPRGGDPDRMTSVILIGWKYATTIFNGHFNLRAKQKYEVLSATSVNMYLWCLKVFRVEVTNVGFKGFWRSGAKGKAVLPLDIWLHILVILFYPMLTGRRNALSKESPKRNIQKEEIETDKRRKHFFHTFLYLLGEWTNQRYVPRRSVVPKTPDSKIGVVGSASLPEKESVHRKPEYLSLSTGSKFATPKSF